jgi:hypothetical protein
MASGQVFGDDRVMPDLRFPKLLGFLFAGALAVVACSGAKTGGSSGDDDDDGDSSGPAGLGTAASSGSLCERMCDCVGCSENELSECEDDIDDQVREAEDEGCGSESDAYVECLDDQLECRDAEIDVDGCDAEERALSECLA